MGALLDLAVAAVTEKPERASYERDVHARETRRARVEAELLANPGRRLAFDVVDVPLNAGAGDPVSVVLAVRSSAGVASGEVHILRGRFDAALFLRALETSEEPL